MNDKSASVVEKYPSAENESKNVRGTTRRQWMVALLANITVFSYGLQVGWIACVANKLLALASPLGAPLTELDIYWLASTPTLAALVSVPIWMHLVDKFGRKPCVLYCAWIQVVAWVILIPARYTTTLMIGRITGGVAGGGCVYIMPMYIREISQDNLRGTLGLTATMLRSLGILAIYAMVNVDYYTILWIVIVVSIAGVISVSKVPESPAYFVKIGNVNEAASTIAYLRMLSVNDKLVQDAVECIKAEDQKFKSLPDALFISHVFNQEAWRKGFLFMVMLMLFNGLNGGLSIVNYAPIFLNVGMLSENPTLQSLSIPAVMVAGSLLAMVLIDYIGRKPLLAVCFLLSMLSFAAVAAILLLQHSGTRVPAWVAVLVVTVPVCSYGAAVSPIPFILAAEMLNFQIRAKVMGCLTMISWGGAYIQLLLFVPISNAFGPHVTFMFFATVNLIGYIAVLVFLPETKRKTVEEIELNLETK